MGRLHSAVLLGLLASLGVPGGQAMGGGDAAPYRTEVRPGEVRLLRGEQVVRSYPVPQGHSAQALVAGGRLAVVTGVKNGWDDYQLRVYTVPGGHLFAERRGVGQISQVYTREDALFVEFASSGAQLALRTLVQNLRFAAETSEISGWQVAENPHTLLFDSPNAPYSPYEAVSLNYFRYNVATRRTVPLAFAVPARPGCGPVEKDGTRGEQETYTDREVVATRHDTCGVFEARFDWVAGPSSPPVIRPGR